MVAARPLVVGSGKVNALYALVSWETVKASAHTVPARTGCCDVAGDATSVPHFTEKTVKRERRTEPGGCDSTGALNFRTTTVSKADANERFGSIREGVKCSVGANTHALSPNPKSDEGLLKSWIWDRLTRRDVSNNTHTRILRHIQILNANLRNWRTSSQLWSPKRRCFPIWEADSYYLLVARLVARTESSFLGAGAGCVLSTRSSETLRSGRSFGATHKPGCTADSS